METKSTRVKFNGREFIDGDTGKSIAWDKLFKIGGVWSNTTQFIIVPTLSVAELGALSKTRKVVSDYLFHIKEWKRRVAKDYNTQYKYVYDSQTKDMSRYYKDYLDSISERPGIEKTYWKRLYEFLGPDSTERGKVVTYKVPYKTRQKLLWFVSTKNPHIFFCGTGYDPMLQVDMRFDIKQRGELKSRIVDEYREGPKQFIYRSTISTPIAFITLPKTAQNGKILIKIALKVRKKLLVSCAVCFQPTNQQCGHRCGTCYCGVDCQTRDWSTHQLRCAGI